MDILSSIRYKRRPGADTGYRSVRVVIIFTILVLFFNFSEISLLHSILPEHEVLTRPPLRVVRKSYPPNIMRPAINYCQASSLACDPHMPASTMTNGVAHGSSNTMHAQRSIPLGSERKVIAIRTSRSLHIQHA